MHPFARPAFLLAATLAHAACGGDAAPSTTLPEGWHALAELPVGVGESAVAALDGKIYVVGGFDTRRTVQIYDLASDRWQLGPALPAGTDNAGATTAPGKLYVIGGEGAALLVYDVASASWSYGPLPPAPRFASVVEPVAGELHLVGGWSFDRANNVSLSSHDALDLATGTYRARAAAPTARNHAASGVIDGKLYVTGGRGPGHEGDDAENLTATEVYDPADDSWRTLAPLPSPRSGGASAVLGGKLYVLGGGLPDKDVHSVVERYDPATDTWERLPDMPAAVTGHRAVAVGDSLYLIGGFVTTADGKRLGSVGSPRVLRYTPPS